jgi:cation:H+ antiporter
LAILLFLTCLALSVVSSVVLSADLDRIGARLGLAEGLLGLLTALGADSPEISSAVTAVVGGHHDVGLGVVFGSNLINLAALLGLSAVVAGRVRAGRPGLIVSGGAAAAITALAVALALRLLPPWLVLCLVGMILLPYALLVALRKEQVQKVPAPPALRDWLARAADECDCNSRKDRSAPRASWLDALSVVPALASVVLASIGMVVSAIDLGRRWRVPNMLIGTLVLAALTGIPNVVAALRLALAGRGAAVVSESLNSNNINIAAGACLPALLLGTGAVSGGTVLTACWMLGLTLLAVGWLVAGRGLGRWGGTTVIAGYLAFVAVLVLRR